MADDRRQQLVDELARHNVGAFSGDSVGCTCDRFWRTRHEWRTHLADALLPLLDQVAADAAAEALEQAAQAWRWSAWSDVPRVTDRAAERIGTANYVGDWIAARAAMHTTKGDPS